MRHLAAVATILALALAGCRTPPPELPTPQPVPEKPEAAFDVRMMPPTVLAVRPLQGPFQPALAGALEEGRVSGWKPAGPPMILDLDGGTHVGLQLATAPEVQPPWRLRNLPESRVALSVVRGRYEQLPEAQTRFREEVEAAGFELQGPVGAVLLDDPGRVAPADLRARLFVPVR